MDTLTQLGIYNIVIPNSNLMRKEALIAVVAGLGIGVIIAFAIWKTNKPSSVPEQESQILEINQDVVVDSNKDTPQQQGGISILSPQNQLVVKNSPVNITGISTPNSILVISAEDEDYIIETSESGAFEQEVELIPGLNQIKFFSFQSGQKIGESELILAFSSNF